MRPLDDALALMDAIGDSMLARIPGAAMMVLDRELTVVAMTGAAWADLGVDAAAVVGRPLRETAPPEAYARVEPEYAAVLAGEARSFALPLRGDRVHWLTAMPIRSGEDGAVDGVMAVSFDQTAARRAEDGYRLLAENATDVVTRHDPSGVFLYVSPSIEGFLGFTPDELLGRSCLELIHPDDLDGVVAALAAASSERRMITLTYRIRRRDGSFAWAESTCRWVVSSSSTTPGVAEIQCSSRDITERRRAERELAQRLAQQSAVARLGDLALQRGDLDALHEEATRLVAETLQVDLVYALEHLADAQMRVRGASGFPRAS